jgi:hypothetical protein
MRVFEMVGTEWTYHFLSASLDGELWKGGHYNSQLSYGVGILESAAQSNPDLFREVPSDPEMELDEGI